MDFMKKIDEKIKKFVNDVPAKGFEVAYLEDAKQLLSLVQDTLIAEEESENPEQELAEIFDKISEIVD